MNTDFNQKSATQKLTLVSDCDGTLLQVGSGRIGFNDKLFDFLIEQKKAGNNVFITSGADNTGIIRLQLTKRKLPADFLDINHEFVDPAVQPVVPKSLLAEILTDLGITRADIVFDDEEELPYLGGIPCERYDPRIFLDEEAGIEQATKLQALAVRPSSTDFRPI